MFVLNRSHVHYMRIEWRESKTVVGFYWYCRHNYCKYQQKGLLSRNWLTKSFSWVHLCLLCHSFGLRQHMILPTTHICAEHRVQIFKGTSSTWGCSSGKSCTCYYLKLKVLEWKGYIFTPIFSSTFCTLQHVNSLLNFFGGKHPVWCIVSQLQSLREMDKTQQRWRETGQDSCSS